MTFPSASTPFCEVRVTTYKRPDLLKRALTSLQEQTYPFWKAIVLDDSPEREGADVVRKINDLRIIYRANPKNLGRNKNIDFAFQSRNIIGGRYACILEDDNYFFPDFIESNIQSLTREKV
ncbi:MAG: glycosyltransferase, partial [Bacteroidota bacterium]